MMMNNIMFNVVKRISYYLASLLAVSFVSAACDSDKIVDDAPVNDVLVLNAHTGSDVATRTSLNGLSVIWSGTDKITAFAFDDNDQAVGYSSTKTEVSQDGKSARFTFDGLTFGDDVSMALYPADTSATLNDDMSITTEIPTEQTAVANSFANDANVAVASCNGTEVKFKNACAIICFTLQNDNVRSVRLSSLDETPVAGTCAVAIDEDGNAACSPVEDSEDKYVTLVAPGDGCFAPDTPYYFVVLPGNYSGFRLEFTSSDEKTAKLKNGTSVDIVSNDNYNFGTIPDLSSKWKTSAPVWETTYALFASDRHENTTALSSATSLISVPVSYACLIGDMVGDGTGSASSGPAFNSSTVRDEVTAIWPKADVNIVWGLHDTRVNDDANIVEGITAGSSRHIYTSYDSKGNVQYYVYGVAYHDMSDDTNGSTAAAAFKTWVSTITDKTIPIFVACHLPIHANRKDNYGAYYWNRAITYAATGSETGTTVTRNVVFFHGHNHNSENNMEHYYSPGTTLKVEKHGTDDTCVIPYTYITGGYLNANKTATLVTVTADKIEFTKYSPSKAEVLGSVTRIKNQ